MKTSRVTSGTPWEQHFGYARAVRRGAFAAVSGTVASDASGQPLGGDAYEQTRVILRRIGEALVLLGGAGLSEVVRLRVLFADAGVAEGFRRALEEAFPAGAPALTAQRVVALVDPAYLLEIEADAILSPEPLARRDEDVPGDEQAD